MNTRKLFVTVVISCAAGAGGLVQAAEPNEDFNSATSLPNGQTVVSDSLDGSTGRLDTLLGQFDPTFQNLLASDDNSSKFGNGLASGLNDLALTADGSIFLAVTGAENTSFSPNINSHQQTGFYQVFFDFFDSNHQFLETVASNVESLQHDLDNFFIFGTPERAGGTVDVHIDNLIGLGDGDPIDFWVFNGLAPGQPFVAEIISAQFQTGLGLFDAVSGNQLDFDVDSGAGMLSMLSGIVPSSGQIVLGVTGAADSDFLGEHAEEGQYTLEVMVIPEPATAVLLALGGLLSLLLVRRRRA